MKKVLFPIFLVSLALTGCATNPNLYKNYCQKDYWGDNNFEIFGRKSCTGDLGKWVDTGNGRSGYFCRSPQCLHSQSVTCTDTCSTSRR